MEISAFIQHFADQFDDTTIDKFSPNTKFRDLEEWDSLTSLSVIAMVDEEYNVKLTGDDFRNSVSIEDIFELVQSRA